MLSEDEEAILLFVYIIGAHKDYLNRLYIR